MTPQEEAIQIADKHYWLFGDGYLGNQHIQHALIQVEDILETCSPFAYHHWQEVKNELLKQQNNG